MLILKYKNTTILVLILLFYYYNDHLYTTGFINFLLRKKLVRNLASTVIFFFPDTIPVLYANRYKLKMHYKDLKKEWLY